VYYVDINYNYDSFYIKIPKSKIKSIDINSKGDMYCYLRDKDVYEKFIKPLEEYIINTLYTNSEKWFNGKRFSQEKISKCMVSNVYDDYKLCITNKNGQQNQGSDLYLHVKELQFIDNRFTYNLILLNKQQNELESEWESDLESESETESELADEYYKE
jgi:hypothetical protein